MDVDTAIFADEAVLYAAPGVVPARLPVRPDGDAVLAAVIVRLVVVPVGEAHVVYQPLVVGRNRRYLASPRTHFPREFRRGKAVAGSPQRNDSFALNVARPNNRAC